MSRLDFGVQIEPQYGFTYQMILDIAKEAEGLGFESLWVSDHFFMTEGSTGIDCLECMTVLSALCRDTEVLRLGPMVVSQSYRNPALLANMVSSLDNISGGRVNFGVGAGWKELEYKAYGYSFPKAAVRIRQLDEVVEIATRLWKRDKATFKGRYYSIDKALCFPPPVQKPRIPVWIGGSGNLTLKVAAKHADAVNFSWSLPSEQFKEKLNTLSEHCQRQGTDYRQIKKSAGLMLTMAENQRELEKKLADQRRRMETEYMKYLSRQLPNIVGTPEQIAERIREYTAIGCDHFILRFHFGEEVESMRLFMRETRKLI